MLRQGKAQAQPKGWLRRNLIPLIGAVMLLAVVSMAVFAPLLAPYDPLKQSLKERLVPPMWCEGGSSNHLLGTDHLGRDVLSRLIYGARVSCVVGIAVVLISGAVGICLGLIAGYYGGWFSGLIMRLCDLQSALPFTLLAILIISVLGSGLRNVILALSVSSWIGYARLIRAQTLQTREQEFIRASRVLGARDAHLMFREILPNVITHAIITAAFSVAQTMITEAGLTFLGLGVEPSIPSWGGMLSDGRNYMETGWWIAVMPGLFIMFTVLSINILGQWARDQFDPRAVKM